MTNRDKIELPPLPEHENMTCYGSASMRDYAYTAVLADRVRRAEQAKPAKPKVHRARVYLTREGYVWTVPPSGTCAHIELCWTDDGRAWIDSEKNRELAMQLRDWAIVDLFAALDKAADALDGGVR